MRVDGENLGAAPIERVLLRHPDVVEAAVYGIPASDVGDQVMAALVLADGATFDADGFRAFLAAQSDLGPKRWPSFVRIGADGAAHRVVQGDQAGCWPPKAPTAPTRCGPSGGNLAGVGYREFPPPPHLREPVEDTTAFVDPRG